MDKAKPKTKNLRKEMLDSLAENPGQLEEGLTLFDRDIPSLLRDVIDLVCLDKNHRLVLIQLAHRKLARRGSLAFFKKVSYLWHWMSDFKEDFLAEVEKKTASPPFRMPPRVIILAPEPNQIFLGFAAHLRKLVMDVDVFRYLKSPLIPPFPKGGVGDSPYPPFSKGGRGGISTPPLQLHLEKVPLDDSKLPSEEDLDELHLDLTKRSEAQYHLWEQAKGVIPNLCGYSLNRKLMPAIRRKQKS